MSAPFRSDNQSNASSWRSSRVNVLAMVCVCFCLVFFSFKAPPFFSGCNYEVKCQQVWGSKVQQWRPKHGARLNAMAGLKATAEKSAYDVFEPEWNCEAEDRIGRVFGDGGKFVCGIDTLANNTDCLVYSIGSNYDTSFEEHVRQLTKCEIHTFDPTINVERLSAVAAQHTFQVHPWGLGSHQTDVNALALPKIMERLNHANRTLNILKIDCEGCEHEALAEIFELCAQGKLGIEQLAIELHGTDFDKTASFFKGADKCGLMIFHKERNHWGCDGYKCVEFSLISKAAAKRVFEASRMCPKTMKI